MPLYFYGLSGPNEGTRFEGKAIRTGGNAGRVEATLPDGELCIGEYSIVNRESSTQMSGEWRGMFDSVYGSGFASSIEWTGQGQGTAVGNKRTVLEVDFLANTRTGHGFGVAKDNKGNRYRVQF